MNRVVVLNEGPHRYVFSCAPGRECALIHSLQQQSGARQIPQRIVLAAAYRLGQTVVCDQFDWPLPIDGGAVI